MCLLKSFSTKAKNRIQYPSPLMLWTKWWNSCLLKPPSPENTVRLSHKPGNKNNVKEEFICLIFSNKYSKLLLGFTDKSDFFKINQEWKSYQITLLEWCCSDVTSLSIFVRLLMLHLSPCWQTVFLLLSFSGTK